MEMEVYTYISIAHLQGLIPGRRVVRPAAADHRRHDLHLRELLAVHRERVPVEHDEIRQAPGNQRPAEPLVVREPRRRDTRRLERLRDRQALIVPPMPKD